MKHLRILVLSKRRYMSRDLIADRYGRFRELPLALARRGHVVHGLCLGYRSEPEGEFVDTENGGTVHWTSLDRRRLLPFGANYWRHLYDIGARAKPDVIFAGSDVPHLVLGLAASRRLGVPLVADLYDNFESYGLARIPGVNWQMRRAIRRAAAVTAVSVPLVRKIEREYPPLGAVHLLENAIPTGAFQPRDRKQARARLGLPPDAILVGTAGALAANRGIDILYRAFSALSQRRPDLHLVLAGPTDAGCPPPEGDRVHYLGLLPATTVPDVVAALDVSVVCNRNSDFGRYCFPQKLYESLACGIPTVVARVGAMAELLSSHPRLLFESDDAASLVAAIEGQLASPESPDLAIPDWQSLGDRLATILGEVARDA